MFIALKPLSERKVTADQVIARLRPKFAHDPRASLFMQAAQDIRVGGRGSNAQYQYTLQGDDLDGVEPLGAAAARRGCRRSASSPTSTPISRTRACRPAWRSIATPPRGSGSRAGAIDQALYDAFGQRQVSTMYARHESVPRRHGGGAAVLAASRDAGRDLRRGRTPGSSCRCRPSRSSADRPRRWRSTTRGSFRPSRCRST